jgi:predicted permease
MRPEHWIYTIPLRLRSLFRRRQSDQELDDELQDHVASKSEEYVAKGLAPEEARRHALLEMGGVEKRKEECRDTRGVAWLQNFAQDLRFGLRMLRKSPGFTSTAVLTLAVAIGATTAIFSAVNGVVLKPLPYPHPGELLAVSLAAPTLRANLALDPASYFIFREQSRTFQDIGIYDLETNSTSSSVSVTGLGEAESVPALNVTDGVLPILGVTPLFGRLFTPADDRPDSPDTVILTYGYWRSKFDGKRSVVGTAINVDGKLRTIIGVLPQRFRFLNKSSLAMLLPIKLDRAKTDLGGDYSYVGIARLKPGVTLAEANADVARMIPIIFRSFPPSPAITLKQIEALRLGPSLRPLKQEVVGNVSKVLGVLMGGISLVLLIAAANVANLLLVRIEGRRRELALRAALGASRARIAAELFSETLILAALGGSCALGVAYGALQVLAAVAPLGLPRLDEISVDGRVVLFTLALSVATSVVLSSVSLFKYPGSELATKLSGGSRSMTENREQHRSRSLLVVVQIALALVLLVSSGLMIRTFRALTRVNPGFVAPSELQTFRVYIPDTEVKDPERVARVEEQIADNIAALPGVSSVGLSRNIPMDGSYWVDTAVAKDHVYHTGEIPPACRLGFFAPGFLKTLGTPLIAGRDFTWSDIYNKLPVTIVSEKFAREYWRDPANALGKQIRLNAKDEWRQVVGVAGDVHEDGVAKQAPLTVYMPIFMTRFFGNPAAGARRHIAFAIRSSRAGSQSLINEVRQAVWSVDPNLPLFEVHTLNYYYSRSIARTSLTLVMLALASGMALLLGVVGLYGVIAYSASQRTHEIGIRMALGGHPYDVLRLFIRQGVQLVFIGLAVGLAAAFALTRFMSALLFEVRPADPLTFIGVALLMALVALCACYVPARRAMRVDPMVALRYE